MMGEVSQTMTASRSKKREGGVSEMKACSSETTEEFRLYCAWMKPDKNNKYSNSRY